MPQRGQTTPPPPALTCPVSDHLGQELEARVPHLPAGAAQAPLQHREKLWGGRGVRVAPRLPTPSQPRPFQPCGSPGCPAGPRLPPRNSWVGGSRSQQPGGVCALRSHRSVAWKAFFRTWGGGAAARRGDPAPASASAPAPALPGGQMGSRRPSLRKQRGLPRREEGRAEAASSGPRSWGNAILARELQGASASSPGTWGLSEDTGE